MKRKQEDASALEQQVHRLEQVVAEQARTIANQNKLIATLQGAETAANLEAAALQKELTVAKRATTIEARKSDALRVELNELANAVAVPRDDRRPHAVHSNQRSSYDAGRVQRRRCGRCHSCRRSGPDSAASDAGSPAVGAP